ncbi:hypothetical protein NEDG_01254 [Nematocida displodere]|uniref:Uncharacterized protein n=1 Tax=Nematocida displodere TaxID=1805483 RepID=A0A177ECE0_9MICR|nr:hypothetical protein NEDG_01254 [Nematocida displodere]
MQTPRTHILARSLTVLALASASVMGVNSIGSNRSNQVAHSTNPFPTINFFARSGCTLKHTTAGGDTYIVKSMENEENLWIHLNKYTLSSVPNVIGPNIDFVNLTLSNPTINYTKPEPLKKNVVEKVLRGLSPLRLTKLFIDGLDLPTDSDPGSDPDSDPEHDPDFSFDPNTKPSRAVKLEKLRFLSLTNMTDASIAWFLSCFDVSECEFDIYINKNPKLTTLQCLDSFSPQNIPMLIVHNAENLANIDCALLSKKKVQDVFELWDTNKKLTATPETLGKNSGAYRGLGVFFTHPESSF